MREFVRLLIAASEKAANIARIIRNEKELFSLLIQEKQNEEKNKRFVQDFKTLADVLIQESLRHDISNEYPEMAHNIYGEENNTFSNLLGETITVSIQPTMEETARLLSKVLGEGTSSDSLAATVLATEIHRDMKSYVADLKLQDIPTDLVYSYNDVGVWIDPIDGTNEYIIGTAEANVESPIESTPQEKIYSSGLHCVTVLIGAFHLPSGESFAGVINQPFYKYRKDPTMWMGRRFWGFVSPTTTVFSSGAPEFPKLIPSSDQKKVAVLSSSEDLILQKKLESNFRLVFSSGAGYKLLAVVLGLADVYVLSKNSTHFWDTCGPHAILKALGGGIIKFEDMLSVDSSEPQLKPLQIPYFITETNEAHHFANIGGIVAYRDEEVISTLKESVLL